MPYALPATVTMVDAPSLIEAGRTAVRAGESVFDLAAVTNCDSSLLACLNEWRREAAQRGTGIEVRNAPESLRRLARLYGVESITL